jgi:hypothetical protein
MPFTRLRPGRLRVVAIPALVVYALAWVPFLMLGAGDEMVRLQMAGSESAAREVVATWSPDETVDVAFLLGVDAVHLLSYAPLFAVGAVWAGRQLRGRAAGWAPVVAWMALAAAAFDAIENAGMVVMVRGDLDAPVPALTTALAMAKLSMLAAAVVFVAAGFVARRRFPTPTTG